MRACARERVCRNVGFRRLILTFVFALLFCLVSCWITGTYAFAENATPKVIRVGFPEQAGFSQTAADGTRSGLVYDYLMEISKYTGWEYQFVEGSSTDLAMQLRQGGIDLMGGLLPSREIFDYPEFNCGYTYTILAARNEDPSVSSSDLSTVSGKVIGACVTETDRVRVMEQFLANNGISWKLKYYSTPDELLPALKNGEVSLILTTEERDRSGAHTIASFSQDTYFIGVAKGNQELLRQLNMALGKIREVDSDFDSKLHKQYFELGDKRPLTFSTAEIAYLNRSSVVNVVSMPNLHPFSYFEGDTFSGVCADMLQLISKKTGLTFHLIPTETLEESTQLLREGKADLMIGIYSDEAYARENQIVLGQSYLEMNRVLIKRKVADLNTDTGTIALRRETFYEIDTDPSRLRYYSTFEECLQAVESGNADYTYMNTYSAEYLISSNSYRNIDIATMAGGAELCFALPQPVNVNLFTIMNKAVLSVMEQELSTLLLKNTIQPELTIAWKTFLQANPQTILLIAVIIIVILVLFFVTWLHHERQLYRLSNIDELTGAPNFNKFKSDAKRLLATDRGYAITYTDLRNFKYVNDRYGFEIGDRMLCRVAGILQKEMAKNELYCRVTGDTFCTMRRCKSREELSARYQKARDDAAALTRDIDPDFHIQLYTGVFMVKEAHTGLPLNVMIDRASLAQKNAKISGNASLVFYEDSLSARVHQEQEMETSAEAALRNGEFVVWFQPKVNLHDMRADAAEALIRWMRPEGMVSPGEFIPLFERNRFIIRLDRYVFEQCCRMMARWITEGFFGTDQNKRRFSLSVNISRVQFYTPDVVEYYTGLKQKYAIPDGYLELEFTESIAFEDTARMVSIVEQFRSNGFRCSIDDFGKGYSSLTVLKDIPVDVLKLDAQFFHGKIDYRNSVMIESVINMARALSMDTVAEGIELPEQVTYLRQAGCDLVQGFVFARPMPEDKFRAFIDKATVDREDIQV